MALTSYLDIVLVVVVAAVAIALGAPAVGCVVGAASWIVVRGISWLVEQRLAGVEDVRRRLAFGVGYKLSRVWLLAGAIIIVGLASSRADALAAALVIVAAFSAYFACSAFAHVTQTRRPAS